MLRARVKTITGNTVHHVSREDEWARDESRSPLPQPAFVKIDPQPDGIFLLYCDSTGACITDGWHQTIEEAKAQAKFEFEIEEADWFDDGE